MLSKSRHKATWLSSLADMTDPVPLARLLSAATQLAVHRLLEEDVVFLLGGVAEARDPHGEDREHRQQDQHHGADQDVI